MKITSWIVAFLLISPAIAALLVLTVRFGFSDRAPSDAKLVRPASTTRSMQAPVNIAILSLSGFEKCDAAASVTDYCNSHSEPNYCEGFLRDKPEPFLIGLRTNLANAEIYAIPIYIAGGDILTKNIVRIGMAYCELTDKNLQTLFAPIDRENAIKYLEYRLVSLSESSYGRMQQTIKTETEFNEFQTGRKCASDFSGVKEFTHIAEETLDGFIVAWVYYTSAGVSGIYSEKIGVRRDGAIKHLQSPQTLVDCGPGIMF